MSDACEMFETPVTGGNVSFYNETDGAAIYPTPVIGMVGVIEDVSNITAQAFQNEGDDIVLLGANTAEMGGSEYLYVTADLVAGAPPAVDLLGERALQHCVLALIHDRLLSSAHDCSEGGLACAIAESALGNGEAPFGADVTIKDDLAPVAALFAESQGRVVISCDPSRTGEVLRIAERHDVPALKIGNVGPQGGAFRITLHEGSVECGVDEAALLRASLIRQGIDLGRIETDSTSARTIDSIDFLARSAPQRSICFVSQPFHLPRVIYLAEQRGLKASAWPALGPTIGWRLRIREALATLRAIFEVNISRR